MKIEHNLDETIFYIELGNTQAVLEYRLMSPDIENAGDSSEDKGTVDFTRTYVPTEHRGQGYAEALVHCGLSWAKQQGLKVQAACWYVQKFL